MDSGQDKRRMNVVGDRLSSLPNDLIHKILSFIGVKCAIETSALSSRWRFIWTSMPYLDFSSENFSTLPKFSKFVTHVLSCRSDQIELSSVKLSFRGKISQVFVKRIINYAFSHNVQQLSVTCLLENDVEFPLSLFSSQSLKYLSLTTGRCCSQKGRPSDRYFITPTSTWELPALTTLYLHHVIFCDETTDNFIGIFSKCANLKNLTLKKYKTVGSNGLSICHPQLSNLTLEDGDRSVKVVIVIAPQLEKLTIIDWCRERQHMISATNLASFVYKGYLPLQLNTDVFHSLEKADICVPNPEPLCADARKIVCLLQQLHSVQFLTINLELAEVLSLYTELIPHQPSPFVNLKSLKIYPESVFSWAQALIKVNLSTKVKSYLLDSSPSATFIMVLREEIIAQRLMSELRVLLDQEKSNTKITRALMEQAKPQPETKKLLQVGGSMTHFIGCWENLGLQVKHRKTKARLIFTKLQHIEALLTNLPASKRAKIQPCFSSLCADADFVTCKTTDCVKTQCDENQSRLSSCFHELATTLEQSS